ncbi:mRNA capping enzyme-domain-containing protein [Fomitopsis serialis]|uniref:mRNA capping enzyme-domain-containing protein n=1 Tax=Fomitopsis serialis TaxID=139415 RepID=UPI002008789C|nr:mRNA capping enzyme-domain-containing protein [Neoantrodia serialis]KAH9930908.1 mRNA capping enzyme-domain-containing protein [Neoantrodia serialis]
MPSRPSTATTPASQRKASAAMPPPLQPASHPATPPPPKPASPRSPRIIARPAPRQVPAPAPAPAPTLPPKPSAPTGLASLPPKPEVDPPPPFAIRRSAIPYAPKFRRTPASSVLVPLSPAEMERYRNFPGGVGTMLLRKRRREDGGELKRERSVKLEENGDEEERRKRRRVGDVDVVVEHYNARPDVGVSQRQESPIIGLKSFNNWVKSVLITRFAHPALAEGPVSPAEAEGMGRGRAGERPGGVKGRVLDVGCGKGGDLTKWSKARVKEYVGVDIAAISVDQARLRHASLRSGPRFAASFFALDCYEHLLRDRLPPAALARPFDVVSMQFCMHYAFESEQKARCMLQNVSENLRPGGTFIGTIPDANQLLERLGALPKDAQDLSFGNDVYTIRFEERAQRRLFGHRYWFFLKDAVDDVPEYVVHWDNFVQMAAEYGLGVIYRREFHEVFEEHHEHPEFAPLLERMHVVDKDGESKMDEDQWEAANIYIAFAFEKR